MADGNMDSEAVSSSADRVIELVAGELRGDKIGAAVRRFASAAQHDLSLCRSDLVAWLSKRIGKSLTQKLVHGFAVYPCMGCKGGIVACAACRGRGIGMRGDSCEPCVALGAVSCDFCAGSGWITYNFVPQPLRPFVILERTRIATTQAGRLPELAEAASPKVIAKEIVQTNRILGALDNAVGAAREHLQSHHVKQEIWRKAIASCAKAGIRLEKRVRLALKNMAAAPSGGQKKAEDRNAYFAELSGSQQFAGTCLHHPNLAEIRKAAARKRRASKQ